VGAFAVHQLRYRIAYGPQASAQLAAQGHSYLDSFAPWLVLLLCLATGSFLASVTQALATGRPTGHRRSLGTVWLVTTCLLIAIYAIQEFLEGLVAAGHPAGLAGIVGHGGWWAGIVAIGVGAVIALLLHAATSVVDAAARAGACPRPLRLELAPRLLPAAVSVARLRPLAASRAGRAPPHRL
jgi:hypothetical protein